MFYGEVPYTNVLYLMALKCCHELIQTPYDEDIKQKIIDFVLDRNKLGGLDTVSVSLLGLWGETLGIDMKRVDNALIYLHGIYPRNKMIPNRVRLLNTCMVFLPITIIGQGDYHNGWNWAWVGCLFCSALAKRGMKVAAKIRMGLYDKMVNKYGTLHEVYEKQKPVQRSLYCSEEAFSEALGCYLFAKKLITFGKVDIVKSLRLEAQQEK